MNLQGNSVYVNDTGIGSKFPPRIMGVLNLSPESFYSKSVRTQCDEILRKANTMIQEGADILDIGGASTAPSEYYDARHVSREVEMERVERALGVLNGAIDAPISVDTTSSEVAAHALNLGASMINDVSGLQEDENMAEVISDRGALVVVMAGCRETCKSPEHSLRSLKESLQIARTAGIESKKIIVDPGIGFGKPPMIDFGIIRKLETFKSLGHPVLIGVSRKAFIGFLLEQENPEERLEGSIAATSIAVAYGADIVRTHDVKETVAACKVGRVLRKSDFDKEMQFDN